MNKVIVKKVRKATAFKSRTDCGKKDAYILYFIFGFDNSLLQIITAKTINE